jgi:1-acyl-sn-glycerol-3-phosphate acyltransferase
MGLLRVGLVVVPVTFWYAFRVVWAAWRGRPDVPMVGEDSARRWSRTLLRVSGTRVVLEGGDVIDPARPQLLVANHVSWFDVLALAFALPGPFRFVAKKELARIPVFGQAWQLAGHVAIDRQDRASALESLEVARRSLEEDHPTVIFFPEGTRSPTGELRAFKKGAFVLAIQTGVEVVPAAIVGSREVMAKGSLRIRTGRTIHIRLGTPIPVVGLGMQDRDTLTRRARDAVLELLGGAGPRGEEIKL